MPEALYILGHPVGHSKSPAMHNEAYRALGLDWTYGFRDCATADEAETFIGSIDWLALNVTMPYKPLAFSCAQQLSEEALCARGANVLVRHRGMLHADNTDGKGCVAYLQRCGFSFPEARVAVCGTGPTSLAILHACAEAGAARLSLHSRSADRAHDALTDYLSRASSVSDAEFLACAYDGTGSELLEDAQLIVDATPLGMKPGDSTAFDTGLLSEGQVILDVVYGQGVTQLIADARAAGCAAYDGSGMLVAQAVETVNDLARITGRFTVPSSLDLFDLMARTAGFAV